jgi:hypothetical protein
MKIKVYVVDLEIPPRVKRWALRLAIPLLVLGAGAVAFAATPHVFTKGDTLQATDLNTLQDQITALQSFQAQATANGAYSLGATYCGATAATAGAFSGPGQLTGYASARAQCQQVPGCSATASHMCTADELIRTRQLGEAITSSSSPYLGWYASAVFSQGASFSVDDCMGWTNAPAGTALEGTAWYAGQPVVTSQYCNVPIPILCCN